MNPLRAGDVWQGTYLGVRVAGTIIRVVEGTVYSREKIRLHLVLFRPVEAFGQTFEHCLVEAKNGVRL